MTRNREHFTIAQRVRAAGDHERRGTIAIHATCAAGPRATALRSRARVRPEGLQSHRGADRLAPPRCADHEHRGVGSGRAQSHGSHRARAQNDDAQSTCDHGQASEIHHVASREPAHQPHESRSDLVVDAMREAAERGVIDDDGKPGGRRPGEHERRQEAEPRRRRPRPAGGGRAQTARPLPRGAARDRDAECHARERMAQSDEHAPADRARETLALLDPTVAARQRDRERRERPQLRVQPSDQRAVGALRPACGFESGRGDEIPGGAKRNRDRAAERDPALGAQDAQGAIAGGGRERDRQEQAELEAEERRQSRERGPRRGDRLREHLIVVARGEAGVGERTPPIPVARAHRPSETRDLGEVVRAVEAGGFAGEQTRVDPPQDDGDRAERPQRSRAAEWPARSRTDGLGLPRSCRRRAALRHARRRARATAPTAHAPRFSAPGAGRCAAAAAIPPRI